MYVIFGYGLDVRVSGRAGRVCSSIRRFFVRARLLFVGGCWIIICMSLFLSSI